MRVLAIIDVVPGVNMDTVRAELANELRGSWKLFEQGVLREAFATATPTRVIFMLEADDATAARTHLESLPLIRAGALRAELVELRPFVNWSLLFSQAAA